MPVWHLISHIKSRSLADQAIDKKKQKVVIQCPWLQTSIHLVWLIGNILVVFLCLNFQFKIIRNIVSLEDTIHRSGVEVNNAKLPPSSPK